MKPHCISHAPVPASSLPFYSTLATAACIAAPAWAEPAQWPAPETLPQLDAVTVTAPSEPGFKVDLSGSAKIAAPLSDVPQTITVVPQAVMQEQNLQSLRQVLSNVSGLTFNTGEGGGGTGDSINIRGFSANANIQVDGLRDSAQVQRTDMFNVESVEVIKGPNSVFGGAGTAGGSINLISKQPKARDATEIGASLGSDSYGRVTLDLNRRLGGPQGPAALRLNLMAQANDVPGRDFIDKKRWGLAPSLTLGMDGPTRVTLSYLHQYDDNQPDFGVPALNGQPLAGVSRHSYFGWRNLDKDRTTTDALTARVEHQLSSTAELQNLTRYSRVGRDNVVSASRIDQVGLPADRYRPVGPQGFGREATTAMWINQTHLTTRFNTAGLRHTLVTGGEVSRESYDRRGYDYGLNRYHPDQGYALFAPPGYWTGPLQPRSTGGLRTTLDIKALYVSDTIALGPRWDLSLGLRHDWIDGRVENLPVAGAASALRTSERQWSGRSGLVFKPTDNGRIYVAYGTAFNPSAEFLAATGNGVNARTSDLGPEKNASIELGTKWELLEKKLALTGALFQVTKDNARELLADGSYALSGKQRVRGIELGLAGKLARGWNVFANYTYLDSETLRSIPAIGDPTAIGSTPALQGHALANTPRHSMNLWTSYALPSGWSFGYGARFVGRRSVTSAGHGTLPSYLVHSAMVGYKVSARLSVQLNLENLLDKAFLERVRQTPGTAAQSSSVEFGDGRLVQLTALYKF